MSPAPFPRPHPIIPCFNVGKRRTYSKEFKVKACELVLKDEIKPSIVAGKPCINRIMLYRWIDEYQTHGEDTFVDKGFRHKKNAGLRFRNSKKKMNF
ncbi:MAG: transposase [Clostridiales bacterium]|nr:transposase [Clostridiales bacterium]